MAGNPSSVVKVYAESSAGSSGVGARREARDAAAGGEVNAPPRVDEDVADPAVRQRGAALAVQRAKPPVRVEVVARDTAAVRANPEHARAPRVPDLGQREDELPTERRARGRVALPLAILEARQALSVPNQVVTLPEGRAVSRTAIT